MRGSPGPCRKSCRGAWPLTQLRSNSWAIYRGPHSLASHGPKCLIRARFELLPLVYTPVTAHARRYHHFGWGGRLPLYFKFSLAGAAFRQEVDMIRRLDVLMTRASMAAPAFYYFAADITEAARHL